MERIGKLLVNEGLSKIIKLAHLLKKIFKFSIRENHLPISKFYQKSY